LSFEFGTFDIVSDFELRISSRISAAGGSLAISMIDLISLGECMVEFHCDGSISKAQHFHKSYGGDTINTAVAAARLGSVTGFISKFGDDPFLPFLREEIAREGVDLKLCPTVPGFNGLYLISVDERGEREFIYYRAGSAASSLEPEDLDPDYIRNARLLHASGISQAISQSCRITVRRAFEISREAGVRTSYDPNYRSKLWSIDRARAAMEEILPLTDIFLPGCPEESFHLMQTADPMAIDAFARERGVKIVAIKEGEAGCVVVENGVARRVNVPHHITPVDTSGAGDAFNAGFLHGLLRGLEPPEAAQLGVATAALKVKGRGALRSLPHLPDLVEAVQDKEWSSRVLIMPSKSKERTAGPGSLVAYVDGGSRGNPGPSGAGVHFELDGEPWVGVYEYLGKSTNNYAEYCALVRALDYALNHGFGRLEVYSDSQLMVRQIQGSYRVKNVNLQALHRKASELIRRFDKFAIHHIPREKNQQADALANKAQDSHASGEEFYRA